MSVRCVLWDSFAQEAANLKCGDLVFLENLRCKEKDRILFASIHGGGQGRVTVLDRKAEMVNAVLQYICVLKSGERRK